MIATTITTDDVVRFGTLLGVFLTAVFAQINAWRAKQTALGVKSDLQTSNDSHVERLNDIHDLVNGGMQQQLQAVLDLTKQVATLSPTPDTAQAVQKAQQALDTHIAKQHIAESANSLAIVNVQPLQKGN